MVPNSKRKAQGWLLIFRVCAVECVAFSSQGSKAGIRRRGLKAYCVFVVPVGEQFVLIPSFALVLRNSLQARIRVAAHLPSRRRPPSFVHPATARSIPQKTVRAVANVESAMMYHNRSWLIPVVLVPDAFVPEAQRLRCVFPVHGCDLSSSSSGDRARRAHQSVDAFLLLFATSGDSSWGWIGSQISSSTPRPPVRWSYDLWG